MWSTNVERCRGPARSPTRTSVSHIPPCGRCRFTSRPVSLTVLIVDVVLSCPDQSDSTLPADVSISGLRLVSVRLTTLPTDVPPHPLPSIRASTAHDPPCGRVVFK